MDFPSFYIPVTPFLRSKLILVKEIQSNLFLAIKIQRKQNFELGKDKIEKNSTQHNNTKKNQSSSLSFLLLPCNSPTPGATPRPSVARQLLTAPNAPGHHLIFGLLILLTAPGRALRGK